MKKTLIILLITYSSFSFADIGWQWQNPKPQGNDLNDVWCLDSLNVIAIGDHGTVLQTNTGGQTWSVINIDSLEYLHSLWFIDNQTGWFLGTDIRSEAVTYVFKTIDGGNSWQRYAVGTAIGEAQNLCFPSDSIGYIVGNNGLVYKSIDKGESWLDNSISLSPPNSMYDVYFLSDSLGWAVGIWGLTRKTTDGGQNWVDNVIPDILSLTTVWFVNPDTGWVAGLTGAAGIILQTTDGGSEWTEQYITSNENEITHLYFTTADSGWCTTDDGQVIFTTDGGIVWNKVHTETNKPLGGVHFFDSKSGWTVGEQAKIFHSTNCGYDWESQSFGVNSTLKDISMNSSNYGWSVGQNGTVLKTINGGDLWTIKTIGGENYSWYKVIQPDATTILVLGTLWNGYDYSGAIGFSYNEGDNWEIISYPELGGILNGVFVSQDIGWILGWKGFNRYLWKTTDGGITWTEQLADTNGLYLASIDFISPDCGWVTAGASGLIFKTFTGGSQWDTLFVDIPYSRLQDICFPSESNGWGVGGIEVFEDGLTGPAGGEGYIYHSSDGGESWVLQDSIKRDAFTAVDFMDNLHGWAVGYRGLFAQTDDGGQTWVYTYTGTQSSFYDVQFISDSEGWIAGSQGAILYTQSGGVPPNSLPENQNQAIPTQYELSSPFPNPFNSQVCILFTLPQQVHVNLIIFNLLGQRVAVLANHSVPKGTFEFYWDGTNLHHQVLASGVYFVQMSIPEIQFQKTHKILLLK